MVYLLVFRRRKNKVVYDDSIELPSMDTLENWVVNLIQKLELKEGEFTILPAYGGVLIDIRHQGISWVPYSEIKLVEKKIDRSKLVESGAMIGGLAVVKATGGLALPFLLIPSYMARAWYRTIARPSPKKSMTFLQSLIDCVNIEQTKVRTSLLSRFEKNTMKSTDDDRELDTFTIHIKQKYLGGKQDNKITKFFKYFTSVVTGIEVPVFPIHPQADITRFIEILKKHNIRVNEIYHENPAIELPEDGIIDQ